MHALPEFTLQRPATCAEAAALLAAEPQARLVAGGTDLMPNLRRGLERPSMLIDLSGLRGFAAVEASSDGGIVLGAGVTLGALADDPAVARRLPALADAARAAAGPGHRSAATLGGNLCQDTRCVFYNQSEWWRAANDYCLKRGGTTCHVAPQGERCHAAFSGDLAPVLLVLGARGRAAVGARHALVAAGAAVPRRRGRPPHARAGRTAGPGARCPRRRPGSSAATARRACARRWISRWRPLPCALVAAQGRVVSLEVGLSGTNSHPLLLSGTQALAGEAIDAKLGSRVAKLVQQQVSPMRSTVTPSNYRRQVASALAQRLLRELGGG